MRVMKSGEIAKQLVHQIFNRKALIIVPECYWTGNECDLLVVSSNLKIIDVEIKISKSDFKADRKKDKWYFNWDYKIDGEFKSDYSKRRNREFPKSIWKHYFAMPETIYDDSLIEFLPSKNCGILLFRENEYGRIFWKLQKRAIANKEAQSISAENCLDIARLANLRMWNALSKI